MPLVTAFNLRADDRLSEIEEAIRTALSSMPEMGINDFEVDFVPVLAAEGFHGTVTRINVDLWVRSVRTKEALQELATRVASAFQAVVGRDRKVTVVIKPYEVEASGWVSL
jgi:phenylpyruvate tautomerase PptA (4-oxalocrotonate tautomerase family)